MRTSNMLAYFLIAASAATAGGQLVLEKKIPVPGMTEGFDHFAFDGETKRIFATAEDQGKVYVVSLASGKQIASIEGFGKPHSILVRSGAASFLVIDSERSKSALISSRSLKRLRPVSLPAGANALVYDPKINVAVLTAGGDRVKMLTSQVVVIDPATGRTIRSVDVNALHLQPMALDTAGGRVFVSIADRQSVGVFDVRSLRMIAEWKFGPEAHHHQPVAFDPQKHRLFVAIDHPGRLLVVNSDTGKLVAAIDIPGDADDLTFQPETSHLILPCGDGFLTVVDVSDPDRARVVQKLATGKDAGTGMWLPEEKRFIVGVPKSGAMRNPEIWVYARR